jgi:hypothetical protein
MIDLTTCNTAIKANTSTGFVTKLNFTVAARPVWEANGNQLPVQDTNSSAAMRRQRGAMKVTSGSNMKISKAKMKPISARK